MYPVDPLENGSNPKGSNLRKLQRIRTCLVYLCRMVHWSWKRKNKSRGFLYNDSVKIEEFSKVKIEWGILKYPEGASYEQQIRNEALMVYISFGHEKIPSGILILPNLPYFIGLFLCTGDKLNTPYIGKYYQEGGRFVCLAHAEPGNRPLSPSSIS